MLLIARVSTRGFQPALKLELAFALLIEAGSHSSDSPGCTSDLDQNKNFRNRIALESSNTVRGAPPSLLVDCETSKIRSFT